jgi:hypothetical protein
LDPLSAESCPKFIIRTAKTPLIVERHRELSIDDSSNYIGTVAKSCDLAEGTSLRRFENTEIAFAVSCEDCDPGVICTSNINSEIELVSGHVALPAV